MDVWRLTGSSSIVVEVHNGDLTFVDEVDGARSHLVTILAEHGRVRHGRCWDIDQLFWEVKVAEVFLLR